MRRLFGKGVFWTIVVLLKKNIDFGGSDIPKRLTKSTKNSKNQLPNAEADFFCIFVILGDLGSLLGSLWGAFWEHFGEQNSEGFLEAFRREGRRPARTPLRPKRPIRTDGTDGRKAGLARPGPARGRADCLRFASPAEALGGLRFGGEEV